MANDKVPLKIMSPMTFNPGDIISLKSVDHWAKQFMIVAMDLDYTTLEYNCTIKEIGSDWIRTNVPYNNIRHLVHNVQPTKLGRLLYGGNT